MVGWHHRLNGHEFWCELALDREVLNQDVEYLGRLQFTAFGKVQESDELRKELPVCRQS